MMARREDKACPRCRKHFECSAGSMLPCQCEGVSLSPEESEYILGRYSDCLCVECLRALQAERETRRLGCDSVAHRDCGGGTGREGGGGPAGSSPPKGLPPFG